MRFSEWISKVARIAQGLFARRKRFDRELEEEMRLHCDLRARELYDPMIFACAGLALASCAMASAYLPARRAASIDPMQALRRE